MLFKRTSRSAALLLSGAALGAGGGYAASASGASSASAPPRAHGGGVLARLRHAVSIEAVIPTRGGAYAKVTIERGTLTGHAAGQLTLREGRREHKYKTISVTLPPSAHVRLDGAPSAPEALTAGDRVLVIEAPRGTVVLARSPAARRAGRSSGAARSSS